MKCCIAYVSLSRIKDNAFEGRAHEGIAKVGNLALSANEFGTTQDSRALAYARPYDIEVKRENSDAAFKAKLTYVRSVGSVVRLELERDDTKTFVEAELTREHFAHLQLVEGETVYLEPRNLRVFLV